MMWKFYMGFEEFFVILNNLLAFSFSVPPTVSSTYFHFLMLVLCHLPIHSTNHFSRETERIKILQIISFFWPAPSQIIPLCIKHGHLFSGWGNWNSEIFSSLPSITKFIQIEQRFLIRSTWHHSSHTIMFNIEGNSKGLQPQRTAQPSSFC